MKTGQKVYLKSPAYKNGRRVVATYLGELNEVTALVLIQGNTRKSRIAKVWLSKIPDIHFKFIKP